ncbi:hypothetical protein NC99_11570 [Sunxiuqinia dokdonensis]|uniref:Uncharacterized protein n=1 Tax=Sunxiuqinia dokdonensis TaxID=1409788 RepID=A0A0L8VCW5_9BACT|nr:hypothetical protein NC99_11570 [Sunxiuqinia dokdonensis]
MQVLPKNRKGFEQRVQSLFRYYLYLVTISQFIPSDIF